MIEHAGNVQPQLDLEEHAHISGVPGKKVFNVDSNGNVLNFTEIQTTPKNNGQIDAFGRIRTSSIQTLFDTQLQYDASPLFINGTVTGTASRTHKPNESCVDITVGTTIGDKLVSQTKEYFRYVPGKSMMIVMSRVLGAIKAGVRVRTGLFETNSGVFFESDGTDFYVVQRNFATGSVVDTRVKRTDWNVDKLDGTGVSGINLDLSKANIYIIDLEWLGVGRVRFGIYGPDGVPHYCHYFENANANTTVYMTTPNLPSRVELENLAGTASPTTMKVICTAVVTEDGGDEATGVNFSVNSGITVTPVTTRRAVLSIRPKATFGGQTNRSKVEEFLVETLTDASVMYEVVYNSVVSNATVWTSVNDSSTVEYNTSGTAVAGGIVIDSGYSGVGFKATGGTLKNLTSKLPFCVDINGVNPTPISFVATSMSGTANVVASLGWKEIY